jgi:hypothetical protein
LHVEIEDGCAMRCDSYEISKCDTHASRMASSPIGVMSDDDGGGGGGDGGGGGGGGGEVRHSRITNGILAHRCAVGTTATRPDASLGGRSKQHQRRPWRVRGPAVSEMWAVHSAVHVEVSATPHSQTANHTQEHARLYTQHYNDKVSSSPYLPSLASDGMCWPMQAMNAGRSSDLLVAQDRSCAPTFERAIACTHSRQADSQPTTHMRTRCLTSIRCRLWQMLAYASQCKSRTLATAGWPCTASSFQRASTCGTIARCRIMHACKHLAMTHHRSVSGITSSVRTAPSDRQAAQTDACTCVHTLPGIAQSIVRSRPTGHRAMHSIALSSLHRAFPTMERASWNWSTARTCTDCLQRPC